MKNLLNLYFVFGVLINAIVHGVEGDVNLIKTNFTEISSLSKIDIQCVNKKIQKIGEDIVLTFNITNNAPHKIEIYSPWDALPIFADHNGTNIDFLRVPKAFISLAGNPPYAPPADISDVNLTMVGCEKRMILPDEFTSLQSKECLSFKVTLRGYPDKNKRIIPFDAGLYSFKTYITVALKGHTDSRSFIGNFDVQMTKE